MTRRAFAAALARHGTDLAAWPTAAREAALALLECSETARTALARALDADASRSPPDAAADLALGRRLLDPLRHALPSVVARRPARPTLHPPMLGWGAVVAAVALGLWLGGAGMGGAPGPLPDLFASAQLAPLSPDQP